jgi:hypothetical protein
MIGRLTLGSTSPTDAIGDAEAAKTWRKIAAVAVGIFLSCVEVHCPDALEQLLLPQ